MLLLSELGIAGQRALLARKPDLRADLVIVGMPEQGEPLIDALISAVQPRLIVLADTEFPASKRPKPALLARLAHGGARLLRLTETGSLTARFTEKGLWLTTVDGREIAVLSSLNR